MPDLAKIDGLGFLSRTDDLLATMNQPDYRSLYWSSTSLWKDFSRKAEFGRHPCGIKREIHIPLPWVPRPTQAILLLKEDAEQPRPGIQTRRRSLKKSRERTRERVRLLREVIDAGDADRAFEPIT